jgi:hypothetical protein
MQNHGNFDKRQFALQAGRNNTVLLSLTFAQLMCCLPDRLSTQTQNHSPAHRSPHHNCEYHVQAQTFHINTEMVQFHMYIGQFFFSFLFS